MKCAWGTGRTGAQMFGMPPNGHIILEFTVSRVTQLDAGTTTDHSRVMCIDSIMRVGVEEHLDKDPFWI